MLLCSTATQKKAAAAAASVVVGVSTAQSKIGTGGGEEEEEDCEEGKCKAEEFDCVVDDQPTDLVLRRHASPT